MKKSLWKYPDIDPADVLVKIRWTEQILQTYGAEHAGVYERSSQYPCYFGEEIRQNVWKIKDEYMRVDLICFPEKPFLVIEFSHHPNGPYEDADPFPYDLTEAELDGEIRLSVKHLNDVSS